MNFTLSHIKRTESLCRRHGKSKWRTAKIFLRSYTKKQTRETASDVVPSVSYLDTTPASEIILPEICRCGKSDPADHTINDESLFYNIPPEDFEVLCPKNGSRKAFIKRHIEEMEAFHEFAIMIRRPALEVINYLKHADYSLPALRYLIYGDAGTGKSITLQHVTHYCMRQGWLIIPTLQAWDWVLYRARYKISQKEELLESVWNKGRFDQPVRAAAWLETFRTMNKEHLTEMKTSKDYIWSKREKTEQGSALGVLVDQGIARPRLATDAIGGILREIRVSDPDKRPRVLVTADNVNALFAKTLMKSGIKGYVDVDDLAFVHNMKKLLRQPWTNGAIAVATNGTYATNPGQWQLVREGQYTYEVLGHKAFDVLDPHIPIEVTNYSNKEMLSQLAYYEDRKFLVGRATTDAGRREIIEVTCNNPWDVAKFCGGLF